MGWSKAKDKASRDAAKQKIKTDPLIQEALALEPEIQHIFDKAIAQEKVKGYHRTLTYENLKRECEQYIGWTGRNPKLKTRQHHEAVVQTMMDLLPADKVDYSS